MKTISLADTAEMMVSADYKERFKAEYWQLAIRFSKLRDMLEKWDNNELDFTPTCNRNLYTFQIQAMKSYKDVLEHRAEIEGINLNE